ncbi:MAG: DUF2218 domain-containing protein, partial [Microvirga sp.]
MLKARCDLQVHAAEPLLARFCDHYTEHGAVRRRGSIARIVIPYGAFRVHARDGAIAFRVRAEDETRLTYMKMGVVHHLREFLAEAAPPVRWSGDGQAGGTPSFWRDLQVVKAFDITPSMRRVVFSGQDLGRFAV